MKEQVCQGVKCEGTGLSVGEVGFNNKFQMAWTRKPLAYRESNNFLIYV